MQGGNATTVSVVALAGAAATLVLALLHYFAAGFFAAQGGPVIDGAVTTLITGVLCFYLPAWGHPDNKPAQPPT